MKRKRRTPSLVYMTSHTASWSWRQPHWPERHSAHHACCHGYSLVSALREQAKMKPMQAGSKWNKHVWLWTKQRGRGVLLSSSDQGEEERPEWSDYMSTVQQTNCRHGNWLNGTSWHFCREGRGLLQPGCSAVIGCFSVTCCCPAGVARCPRRRWGAWPEARRSDVWSCRAPGRSQTSPQPIGAAQEWRQRRGERIERHTLQTGREDRERWSSTYTDTHR